MGKEITCINCGWHWNTADSEEYDKYVCHKCGFDNRTFYDSEPIGKYNLRDGGRTIAQTPSPKKDRIYGSKVNPKGSASSEKSASKIILSEKIIDSLKKKLSENNNDKVSLNDLKAVYRRGLGAYSSSHRPTISGGKPNSRNAWAMARVNKFLEKAAGKKVKAAYVQDDDLLKYHLGGDMTKHLAPNGKPSNLTHEQWHLVRTPEFKAWFGDWENDPKNASKVVDENGEPLVVYHGQRQLFNKRKKFNVFKQNDYGYIYFAKNKEYVLKNFLYKGNLYECFLNIRNIIDGSEFECGKNYSELKLKIFYKRYGLNYLNGSLVENQNQKIPFWLSIQAKGKNFYGEKVYESISNQIVNSKYEGFVFYETSFIPLKENTKVNLCSDKKESTLVYVAFYPNQIKLADGTNTTFDANNPDIRYEQGGTTKQYKTIASFDNSSVVIYDGNLGYKDILDLTDKLPKNVQTIEFSLKDESEMESFIKWSSKEVQNEFGSEFEDGYPIIYSVEEEGQKNIKNAYGELKNGKKVVFDVEDLTWEEDKMSYADGGKVTDCKEYIMQNKSLFANGYFFDMNKLSEINDPYGEVPKNLDFTLIAVDTINPTILADELSQLCNLSKSQSYIVIQYFIDNAERFNDIEQIKTEKIVIVDRDNIVSENLSYANGGIIEDENGYLKYTIEGDELIIDNIKVYKQRLGTGKKLLKQIKDFARKNDLIVMLYAYPQDETITDDELKEFYISQGFELHPDDADGRLFTYANGGEITNPCIKEVIKIIYSIQKVEDCYIEDGKLVIVFVDELMVYGIGIINYHIGEFKECHDFIEPEAIMNDKEDYKSIYFNLKKNDATIGKYHLGGDMSKHLAPNGEPSNLNHEQWHLVRTPAFKAWFGDWENDPKDASKVVDKNGEPLVVYHGTDKKFDIFNLDFFGKTDSGFFGKGFYFTHNKETAQTYAKISEWDKIIGDYNENGLVLICFLDLKNPIEVRTKYMQKDEKQNVISKALLNNQDGAIIIVNERFSPNTEFIACYPNQIKLADGTNTTFDANNPDIRYKEGGELENKETYAKWKSLVNMSSSELERFYNSEEGKVAGLKPSEAKAQGIDSGRESARWILKMKDTKVSDWTPTMWKWANKQISFISRMSGMKGSLYDDKGNKTRKHIALLIWGHNPEKKNNGGMMDIRMEDTVGRIDDPRLADISAYKEGGLTKNIEILSDTQIDTKVLGISKKNKLPLAYIKMQLKEGVKTESEHTNDKQIATKIALDHLAESPYYYLKLKEMEKGLKSYKNGGEINADDPKIKGLMTTKAGSAGGLLVGNRHSEGGIKAINKSSNTPLEMEGGEVVITRNAVTDSKKREFNGEMLTNREILSKINQSGGGISFADGGDIPEKCACSGKHYKYGGNLLPDFDIVDDIMGSIRKDYGIQFPDLKPSKAFDKIFNLNLNYESGGSIYNEGGMIRLVDKKVPSFKEFISKNNDIYKLSDKEMYKNYLFSKYRIVFNDLPSKVKVGLLLGNQNLVDNYING